LRGDFSGDSKRARIAAGGDAFPLEKDEILDGVFSFVGLGEYYFAAGVSRRWKGRYIKLCYTKAAADVNDKLRTSHKSAVMTAARLQLALDGGVTMAALQKNVFRLSNNVARSPEPIDVLKLARQHDLEWSFAFTLTAAFRNNLRSVECPWCEGSVLHAIAAGGTTEVLEWVQSQISTTALTGRVQDMLETAAQDDNLQIVQWLRQRAAAEWPTSFCDTILVFDFSNPANDRMNRCWSKRAVQWALANGGTWGNWQCSLFSAGRYTAKYVPQAAELFEWAHENGCPCTCEQNAAGGA
jgi:hypothetical protein